MKLCLPLILILSPIFIFSQNPQEATLLGTWSDPSLPPSVWHDNTYNEIWGVVVNDREIAVIGSTNGTHFIDVTDPTNPVELVDAFVPGAIQGPQIVHRDYHDHEGYLYAVCDENISTLQIIDISDLPNSVEVVYDSKELLKNAHNIFIDPTSERMYACGVRDEWNNWISLQIYSIEDPNEPELLSNVATIGNQNLPYVHDVYVQNDTAYLNCGTDGFYVVDFADALSPTLLGTMEFYTQQGYNHSGWLDRSGDYYYLADENHDHDLKVVDVRNFDDMSVVGTFNAEQTLTTIPHNLIVRCDYLYVSYYFEGLQVYDISDPTNPVRAYYYDTSTRTNDFKYEGAWGVYPFFPSGNILVSDMQEGLFVFEGISDHACEEISSTEALEGLINSLKIFPQPATAYLEIQLELSENQSNINFELVDAMGRTVQVLGNEDLLFGNNTLKFDLAPTLAGGFYFLKIQGEEWNVMRKVVVNN